MVVGSTDIHPSPAIPRLDRAGVLAASQILIPGLDAGTHTVRATIGGVVVSAPFTITSDDAPLVSTGEQAPADAFKVLIDSGNLLTVYWFDAENQTYLSYDPDPANAGFKRPGYRQRRGSLLGPADRRHDLPWEDPVRRVVPGGTTLKQSQIHRP